MKCATDGCSHEGRRECSECSRNFCDAHIETCSLCQELVCFDCRDEHDANNPQHEEGAPAV
jgi:hypothetical protein